MPTTFDALPSSNRVNSDKTHLEHNKSALIPVADMGADMDFRRSGQQKEILA